MTFCDSLRFRSLPGAPNSGGGGGGALGTNEGSGGGAGTAHSRNVWSNRQVMNTLHRRNNHRRRENIKRIFNSLKSISRKQIAMVRK